jgi:hypothetical protein
MLAGWWFNSFRLSLTPSTPASRGAAEAIRWAGGGQPAAHRSRRLRVSGFDRGRLSSNPGTGAGEGGPGRHDCVVGRAGGGILRRIYAGSPRQKNKQNSTWNVSPNKDRIGPAARVSSHHRHRPAHVHQGSSLQPHLRQSGTDYLVVEPAKGVGDAQRELVAADCHAPEAKGVRRFRRNADLANEEKRTGQQRATRGPRPPGAMTFWTLRVRADPP